MTVLLGASGSGKSLILKMILGLMRPDSGTIHINGVRTDDMPEAELMKRAPTSACYFRKARSSTR